MTEFTIDVVIPDRPTFKAAEVCELLKVQPYVLRSWENEFKDLGAARTPGGPRVYRRGDVERAFRIRQLVFEEGLTLAGVRRRLDQEKPQPDEDEPAAEPARGVDPATRIRIERARQGLRGVLDLLDRASPVRPGATRGPHGPSAMAPDVDAGTGANDRAAATNADATGGELFDLETSAEVAASAERETAHPRKPARRRKGASA